VMASCRVAAPLLPVAPAAPRYCYWWVLFGSRRGTGAAKRVAARTRCRGL